MGAVKTGHLHVWQIIGAQSRLFCEIRRFLEPCSYPSSEIGQDLDPKNAPSGVDE